MRHSLALIACSAALGVNAAPASGFFDSITDIVRRTFYPDKGVCFSSFLDDVKKATYDKYKHTNVSDEAAFQGMREHVLLMYSGVKQTSRISHFVLDDIYGDCIPIMEQPSVHLLKLDRLEAPPVTANGTNTTTPDDSVKGAPSILTLKLKDRYGNPIQCAKDTAPMQRLTLESLTRFSNLTEFFRKARDESDSKLSKRDSAHSYARTIDTVTNFGGNSWLNLWNPNSYFSISQHWYVVNTPHQTVEGGWTVNHEKWDGKARLFIYWTPDDYATGCWNRDCVGFVQTNGNWYLGGPWNHYSTYNGDQWGFEMQWKLYKGNWWLFLRGPGAYEAVGYYPAKVYNNGPITKHADYAKWGGEVAHNTDGTWGEMGSGHFPPEGFRKAAYQKTIFTIPRDEDGGYGVWAALSSLHITKAACYDIKTTPAASGGSWGSHFFFGGPGGKDCA